jgi:4-aminobutyrate aminotransferase-like enzyme
MIDAPTAADRQGTIPPSVAWASAFAEQAPRVEGPIPGPRSNKLYQRCKAREFGGFPWIDLAPVAFERGLGVTMEDVDGNNYIDLTHGHMGAGLGHANPEIADAVDRQMRKLTHLRNQPTMIRAELMERMAQITPGDLNLFAFYSSGTEATEGAMRVARAVTGGHEFFSIYGDYHGRTSAALGTSIGTRMTGPRPSGMFSIPGAFRAIGDADASSEAYVAQCLEFAEQAIAMNSHGALAGIVMEPITNASGARVYPPGYLKGMRELADRKGALLIFDEHATGLGRTGTMWAGDPDGVVPDVMFFGKFLGNGYPITVVAASERFRDIIALERQSSTHGGQPVACAAALVTIDIVLRDDLAGHAARAGAACIEFMQGVVERHPIVARANGRGYQLAFEFVDPVTGRPSQEICDHVYVAAVARGVLPSPVGAAMRVSPMMVASEQVAIKGLRLVEEAIAHVEASY